MREDEKVRERVREGGRGERVVRRGEESSDSIEAERGGEGRERQHAYRLQERHSVQPQGEREERREERGAERERERERSERIEEERERGRTRIPPPKTAQRPTSG